MPADCVIIVVGENDLKEDGLWPGKEGAEKTAHKLSLSLGRPVLWAMPPDSVKDGREWVAECAAGFGEGEDWAEVGREIAGHLGKHAVRIDPQSRKPGPARQRSRPTT